MRGAGGEEKGGREENGLDKGTRWGGRRSGGGTRRERGHDGGREMTREGVGRARSGAKEAKGRGEGGTRRDEWGAGVGDAAGPDNHRELQSRGGARGGGAAERQAGAGQGPAPAHAQARRRGIRIGLKDSRAGCGGAARGSNARRDGGQAAASNLSPSPSCLSDGGARGGEGGARRGALRRRDRGCLAPIGRAAAAKQFGRAGGRVNNRVRG